MRGKNLKRAVLFAVAACAVGASAQAQVDTVVTVVNSANAMGTTTPIPAIATFGYDPSNNRVYVCGFNGTNQQLRRIDNVDGAQSVTTMFTNTPWQRFDKGGNLANGGGLPTVGGLLLNPQAIGLIPANGNAWFMDACAQVTDGTGARPDLTPRIYQYNLAQDVNGDLSDELSTRVTLQNLQQANGNTTNTADNSGRQFAWSGDGQSIYFALTGSAFQGIYKTAATTGGTPMKLLGDADVNTEPAVLSAGGVDTIYFRGGASTSNLGGIDKITHDGVNTSARTVAVTAATINDFLEVAPSTVITTFSMCTDADGNIYFNNTDSTSARRGIYKLDAQGRLSKVASYAERQSVFGGTPNSNTLRMQSRTVSFNGTGGPFNVTQILYAENSANLVAGTYAFKVGDFNRDNVVDQTDIGLFKSKLTVKAGPALAVGDSRYDLNGNGICSFKDVKILQQFYGFYDGDANIDKTVDTVDFNLLAANFGATSGKIWTQGDFNGDEAVDTVDFNLLASNFSLTAPGDSLASLVPEPAGFAVVALGSGALLRRRRQQ